MPSSYVNSRDLVARFTQELDQLLANLGSTGAVDASSAADLGTQKVDIRQEDGVLTLSLPAPGARLEDVRVSLSHGVLTVALRPSRPGH